MAENTNLSNQENAVLRAQQELENIQRQVEEALSTLKGTENILASKEQELKSLEKRIGLMSKLGFFGDHVNFSDLFNDYRESATTRNGLSEAEFVHFLSVINYFNNAIDGETRSIVMDGHVVQLHDIPFDARLKAILVPASITYDVYNVEMHDFKEVDTTVSCNISLDYWIRLQQKFFRNWKNKNVDESNSLKDMVERATLQQVSKRVFFDRGTATLASNYWRPEAGEIYQMPIHISVPLWDVHGDCVSYTEAVFRTFHAMYGRIVTN